MLLQICANGFFLLSTFSCLFFCLVRYSWIQKLLFALRLPLAQFTLIDCFVMMLFIFVYSA